MTDHSSVSDHYSSGSLFDRLSAMLKEDGVDTGRLTVRDLAPYDQFHSRGIEATEELADMLDSAGDDHLLDVGSGFGGPARYMAERFGCRVTGIDLTPEFCDVARRLNELVGLRDRIAIEQGNAQEMPFTDGAFDAAYSMNVSMNIADKAAFYAELNRVLKPGGRLVLAEIAQGPSAQVEFPTPWARTPETSFLNTPDETRVGLEAAGFTVDEMRDTVREVLEFGARSRALVEQGGKPPQRAVSLVHGELAEKAMSNTAKGVKTGALVPVEVSCRKTG